MPHRSDFQLQGARNRALNAWRLRHIDPQYAEADAKRALDIGQSLGDFTTSAWASLSLAFHAIHAGTNLLEIQNLIKRAWLRGQGLTFASAPLCCLLFGSPATPIAQPPAPRLSCCADLR